MALGTKKDWYTKTELGSNANGLGASLIGIEDVGGYFTGTEVETVLQEVGAFMVAENLWDRGATDPSAPYLTPHTANDSIWITSPGKICVGVDPYMAGNVAFINEETVTNGKTSYLASLTVNANNKYVYGGYFEVNGANGTTGNILVGQVAAVTPKSTTDTANSFSASLGSGATIDDPTVDQIVYYGASSIAGTDANMKKWFLYNGTSTASTYPNAGKVFLGGDNIATYWGTGYDANVVFDGTNLVLTSAGNITLTPTGSVNITTGLIVNGSVALTSVSTGTGDNDKFVTQGYVDDAVAGENLWDRTGTTLFPHTSGDIVRADGGLVIGIGAAATDYTLTFDGETNDGVLTWMEDEDTFDFSSSIYSYGGTIVGIGDGTSALLGADRYSDDDSGGSIRVYKARGSYALPATVNSGDVLGAFFGSGRRTGANVTGVSIRYEATANWGAGAGAKIVFSTTDNGTVALDDRMTITHDGNVGIGYDTPSDPLYIQHSRVGNFGLSDNDSTLYLRNNDTGDSGTTLTLSNDNGSNFSLTMRGSGAGTDPEGVLINNSANTPMQFNTNNSLAMYITAAHLVGIGTNNPLVELEVNGNLHVGGDNNAKYLRISRYNGTYPYAYIVAKESPSALGTAGFRFDVCDSGTERTALEISSTGDFILGTGVAGKDMTVTFNGETNDGVITWKEDEDWFLFNDYVRVEESLAVGGNPVSNVGIFGYKTFADNTQSTYAVAGINKYAPSSSSTDYYHYAGYFEFSSDTNVGSGNNVKGITGLRGVVFDRGAYTVGEIRGLEGITEHRSTYTGTGVSTIYGVNNETDLFSDTCDVNTVYGGFYRVQYTGDADVNLKTAVNWVETKLSISASQVPLNYNIYSIYNNSGGFTGDITDAYHLYIADSAPYTDNNQTRVGIHIDAMPDPGAYTGTTTYAIDIAGTGGERDGIRFRSDDDIIIYGLDSDTIAVKKDFQVGGTYNSSDGSAGWTGSFTNGDGDTVTVKDGIITDVS